jgi:AraC family transcriptional regulator of adaptative response/methylated-DNA-[protein]-cysteine methyltransferase
VRLRRYFRQRFHCTFQQWQRQQRLSKVQEALAQGATLSRALKGYESDSGYRAALARLVDRGSASAVLYLQTLRSPLGELFCGVVNDELVLLEYIGRQRHLRQLQSACRQLNATVSESARPLHARVQRELDEYFAGRRRSFTLPLRMPGTAFQQKVWQALLAIPCGQTCSYQALAEAVGVPGASRAVGTANGANRIAIVVPCHRVINKSGNLGGYGGGLARKSALLKLEREGK